LNVKATSILLIKFILIQLYNIVIWFTHKTIQGEDMSFEAQKQSSQGFEGEVSGMTLADLIQIKNISRFSGCLSIEHRDQKGTLFFRDGELVHAETGDTTGSDAFYTIIHWPGGDFRSTPKLTTTCHTIHENVTFMLLEAHRLKDEQTRPAPHSNVNTAKSVSALRGEKTMSDTNSKLAVIPEVEYAVLLNKDGSATDDDSYEGSTHAANAFYLSMFAEKLGQQLGAGELLSATVQGTDHHLLLFKSKNHFLKVTACGTSQIGAVESTIRKALSNK
jgi:predicted regulator of Ras-like GTPase activity (Roadblock/LC7/MglB family)